MREFRIIVLIVLLSGTVGCQTIPKAEQKGESSQDVEQALESIAGAVSQKDLSEEEIKNFKKQLRSDPEAQSAVKAISNSMSGKNIRVKYCPVCGRRYDPKIEKCPIHGVELKLIEP